MKKIMLMAVLAATLGAPAQHSATNSVGLGLLSLSDSIRGFQLSPVSSIAEHTSGMQLASEATTICAMPTTEIPTSMQRLSGYGPD